MMSRSTVLAGASALALGLAALNPAQAAVFSNATSTALTATPAVISLGGGAATFSFTSTTTGFGPGTWVSSTGTGGVSTIFGAIGDFSAGATIDAAQLFTFAAYPTATQIPFSAADDFIGFTYVGTDGRHFGYAEVAGPTLLSYGYESTPNTAILTGAMGMAAPAPVVGGGGTTVPEPATVSLLLGGLAALGLVRRRNRPGLRPA